MAWPPPGIDAGMQLPPTTYINWTPQAGNVGYDVGSLVNQLRGSGQNPLAGYGVPTVDVQGGISAPELAALRTQGAAAPAALPGGGGLGAAAAEEAATGTPGLVSKIFGASKLSGIGPAFAEGGLGGGLGAIAKAAGPAIAYQVGGQVLGGINNALPYENINLGGGATLNKSDATAWLKGAGTGAAVGSIFGAPGAFIGGAIGGSAGALQNVMGDYSAVNKYSDLVDQFVNVNKHMPASMRADAKKAALQIHNSPDIPLAQKPAALQQLIQQMKSAKQQKASTKIAPPTKAQLKVQAQMLAHMQPYIDNYNANAQAAAAGIRAGIPSADPRLQPIMEQDAANRIFQAQQFGNNLAAATYMQPQIDRMDAQLALYRQYIQQLQAQGGSQGTDLATALANAGK